MIVFSNPPEHDRITVEGREYVRDGINAAMYRLVEHQEPPLHQMLDEMARADWRLDIRTDGAFGSGEVEVSARRPAVGDATDMDTEWGDTVEECVSALWHTWCKQEQTA